MKKAKVLSVYFDEIIKKIESLDGDINLNDISFYYSKNWPSRANSTARLNIANYKALIMLDEKYDIKHYYCTYFDENLKSSLDEYDYILIHQNASKNTFSVIHELLEFIDNRKITAKLVFGTEGTWSTSKEFLNDKNINDIYFSNLLLRHTAKTDREIYITNNHIKSKVEEFELGVDTEILSFGKDVKNRKYITFVKAPEGRVTKNNSAIDNIIKEIKKTNLINAFQIKIIAPPYSNKDYWELMSETVFFIFVSNSETFSYCLNDAKSLGAITFYPNHMYCTKIGARFVVDNYPRIGRRYSSIENLIQQMKEVSSNETFLKEESIISRKEAIDIFSIEKISRNWDLILSGKQYRKNKLFVFSEKMPITSVVSFCKENNISFAMPYRNKSAISWYNKQFSHVDRLTELVFIKDYLSDIDGELKRSFVISNDMFHFGVGADVRVEKIDETMAFFSLLVRINKIDKIILDKNIENNVLDRVLTLIN